MAEDDVDDEFFFLFQRWREQREAHEQTMIHAMQGIAISNIMHGGVLRIPRRASKGRVRGTKTVRRGFSSWVEDYLGENPMYTLQQFREVFRVPRALFYRIRDDMVRYDPVTWSQRKDAAGKLGQPAEVEALTALRYLGTGRPHRDLDDNCRMSPESQRFYTRRFCEDVITIYGDAYLNRFPNQTELQTIADGYEKSGFAGCAGCVDCMCLEWKNCPVSEKGQYHNSKDSKLATLKVEAWCDMHLYIWHWYAGRPGTNNDKTMVSYSPLFTAITTGTLSLNLPSSYRILPYHPSRTRGYFLVDGIYPRWPIFILPIHSADNVRESRFSAKQEGRRKDIERAFGVIQGRFKSLRYEDFRWFKSSIITSSHTCVILHNMIVRMNQEGYFSDDIAEEDEDFNLITEMRERERTNADQRRLEQLENVQTFQAETDNMYFEQYRDYIFARESLLMSGDLHEQLMKELSDKFSSGTEL